MASRSVRRDLEQPLQPLPLLVAERPQPYDLLSRRGDERSCRTLGGSPGDMRPFGSCLMPTPETGPPQAPGSPLLGLVQQVQQATQFRHTQVDALLSASRFFSCARVTTSTA